MILCKTISLIQLQFLSTVLFFSISSVLTWYKLDTAYEAQNLPYINEVLLYFFF